MRVLRGNCGQRPLDGSVSVQLSQSVFLWGRRCYSLVKIKGVKSFPTVTHMVASRQALHLHSVRTQGTQHLLDLPCVWNLTRILDGFVSCDAFSRSSLPFPAISVLPVSPNMAQACSPRSCPPGPSCHPTCFFSSDTQSGFSLSSSKSLGERKAIWMISLCIRGTVYAC